MSGGFELECFFRERALAELADRWFAALPVEARRDLCATTMDAYRRERPSDLAAVLRTHGLRALRRTWSRAEVDPAATRVPCDVEPRPDEEPLPGWVPVPPTRQPLVDGGA